MSKILLGALLGIVFGYFFNVWFLVLTSCILLVVMAWTYISFYEEIGILVFWLYAHRILAFFSAMAITALAVRWQPSWTEGLKSIFLR